MESYGQLKLELISKGLVIPEELRGVSEVTCGYCDGQPGDEISLSLAENFIVKVPLKEPGRDQPKLKLAGSKIKLNSLNKEIEVGIVPLPNFVLEWVYLATISYRLYPRGYCGIC